MAKQAINAPRRSIFMVSCFDLVLVGKDTDHGPEHPRYDERVHNDFDEDIVQGMMKPGIGVKLPIVVVKNDDGDLEVDDGRQRVINAREASRRLAEQGLPPLRVPCLPPEKGGDGTSAILKVMLNEHRQEDTAMGRATKAQQLVDMGYTLAEISPIFRCSENSLRNYLSLLDLLPEVQERIVNGLTPATVGYELASKGEAAQRRYLDKLQGGKTEAEARPRPSKPKAPTKAQLRALAAIDSLPEDFRKGLQYALGVLDPAEVEGLAEVLNPSPESHKRAVAS